MSRYKAYAGIGSQKTPEEVCKKMTHVATILDHLGWTLRSGGAKKADTAFAMGTNRKEEYLPWHRFNGVDGILLKQTREIYDLAGDYWDRRPNGVDSGKYCDWAQLKDTTKLFMMRNCNQILGEDLKTPSKAVICWTPNGAMVGGTSFAMWIAMQHNIPIFNLANDDDAIVQMENFFDPDKWKDEP